MCKKCSRRNLGEAVSLLEQNDQSDIALKFTAFGDHVLASTYDPDKVVNDNMQQRMIDLALSLAQGYMPQSHEEFAIRLNSFEIPSNEREIRQGMKKAMLKLFNIYGNRLPWVLYASYMFMVTRPNMHVAERLPDLKELLPSDLAWECVDAIWHGLPPATSLYMHILATIFKHTRTIPLHGCGCNHYLPPIKIGEKTMGVLYPAPEDIRAETEVPVSHYLVAIESLVRGLPHSLGETEKSLNQHAAKAPLLNKVVPLAVV